PVQVMGADQATIDAAKKEGEVVLWITALRNEDKVLEGFRKLYPEIKVKIWPSFSTPLANKLIEESKVERKSADVVITSLRQLPRLRKANALGEFDWPASVNRWPYQPKHNFWRNITVQLYLPTYNPNVLPKSKAPKSWADMKNPTWKQGQALISSSGANYPLMTAYQLRTKENSLNWEASFDYWGEVIKNSKPRVGRGFQGPNELLVGGSYAILLLNVMNDAIQYQEKGAPIEFVPVDKVVGSTRCIAQPRLVKNPNASRLLIEYILSQKGMADYADAHAVPPVDPQIRAKTIAGRKLKELGVEFEVLPLELQTRENVRKATNWWSTTLGVRRGKKK
nr:extracellular solute-binding protein [Deltaproteobacteria bacterium]